MLFPSFLFSLPAISSSLPVGQTVSSSASTSNTFNYDVQNAHVQDWPSIHESAVAARRILQLDGISTLSSVFPEKGHSSYTQMEGKGVDPFEARPPSVAGAPIGLMDYHASCNPFPHDPTIVGVTIATTMRNAAAGSNVTLGMRYRVPSPAVPAQPPRDDPWAYLPANLPRFALVGYIERLDKDFVREHAIDACFFDTHPDAYIWGPGGELEPHEAWWGRLVVQEVYFFGGFGDRARIGWIPLHEWQSVTQEEIDNHRLPGEEGWRSPRAEAKQREREKLDSLPDLAADEEWEDPLFANEEL